MLLASLAIPRPDLYSEEVRRILLHTSVGIVISILMIATGVACMVFARLRKRSEGPALVWFGILLILYGVRNADFLRVVAFLARPIPDVFWNYFAATITHIIQVPVLLFVREIFPNWRRALNWILWAQIPIVAGNFAGNIILHQPYAFNRANNVLTIVLFVGFVIAVFTLSQKTLSTRGLRWGLLFLSVTIVINNLAGIRLISLPFNPEPIGFAVFVLTLGSLITSRAVENQQRLIVLDRELAIARQIQTSILPSELPCTERLQIAARYLPMTEVAGDFYDVLPVDETHLGVIIADVSGHGVPAALIASMVKMAFSAQLPHADNPELVLAGLNRTLCGKLQGQFVTAAYLFLDLDQHLLRYAAAGHPAILYHQAINNSIAGIEENGLPLGMISVATYTFIERPLVAGSRFLLYTDGLLEVRNPEGEFFGVERIQAALSATGSVDAEHAADGLLEWLKQWAGPTASGAPAQQEDDLTLLIVDVR